MGFSTRLRCESASQSEGAERQLGCSALCCDPFFFRKFILCLERFRTEQQILVKGVSFMIELRLGLPRDHEDIWRILEPVIRAGETYALPRDMGRDEALAYWTTAGHQCFVAEEDGNILGTYSLRANQAGGGAHVANCGYVTAHEAIGRGIAGAMCEHSLNVARNAGFRAMQFNFVVASNARAIALWHRLGFETVGRVPEVFLHPKRGYTDALVMYRRL